MFDEVDEVAFALWTADTANASREDWVAAVDEHDRYRRMARAAFNSICSLLGQV
ncbi:MAG: hypothetical protein ABJG14_17690 [Sulfitobacter sp.]|uniref:hypothetical protein n=1 Tax=Alphaproteobacteria TaxID=28211 RepID=UPI0032657A90